MPSNYYIAELAKKEAERIGYCPDVLISAYGNIIVRDFLSADAIRAINAICQAKAA